MSSNSDLKCQLDALEQYDDKSRHLYQRMNTLVAEFVKNHTVETSSADLKICSSSNYIHRLFRLQVANAFKLSDVIILELQSGYTDLIQHVFRFKWIYTDDKITDIKSLQEIFPTLSYNMVKSILIPLSKNIKDEQRARNIFEFVKEEYGDSIAQPMFTACSMDYIQETLNSKFRQLSTSELKQLFLKHHVIAFDYLNKFCEEQKKVGMVRWPGAYNTVLIQQIQKYPDEFLKLCKKYGKHFGLHFGARRTKTFVKSHKQEIMENLSLYVHHNLIDKRVFMRRLTLEEYRECFVSLLPKHVGRFQTDFEQEMHSLLNRLPLNERYQFLETCFRKAYGDELTNFPEYFTARMISILPIPQREEWVIQSISKLPINGVNEHYIYSGFGSFGSYRAPLHREGFWTAFLPIEMSIPKLKDMLHKESDVDRRAELVAYLVLTCRLNNDVKVLAEVSEYVADRFRNDQMKVRQQLLEEIRSRFSWKQLTTDAHWKPLFELVQRSALSNEMSYSDIHFTIVENYTKFLLMNKMDVDPVMQFLVKLKTKDYYYASTPFDLKEIPSEYGRKFLRLYAEKVSAMFEGVTSVSGHSIPGSTVIGFVRSLESWNKRHHKHPISITDFPWFEQRVNDILANKDDRNSNTLASCLSNDTLWSTVHLEDVLTNPSPSLLLHFLRKHGQTAFKNSIHEIMQQILENQYFYSFNLMWKLIKSMPALQNDIVEKCMAVVNDSEALYGVREKSNAILVLSHFLSPEKYTELAKPFYPIEARIDTNEEDSEMLFSCRKMFVSSLKNLTRPVGTFDCLRHFCIGDYLKLSVGSLYSICIRCPRNQAISFLKGELNNKAVSFKKHVIRLLFTLFPKRELFSFAQSLWNEETHSTIRTIVLIHIFEIACRYDATEQNWKLLESALQMTTIQEKDTLELLVNWVQTIPTKLLPRYVDLIWKILCDLSEKLPGDPLLPLRIRLLSTLSGPKLNEVSCFVERLFQQHLLVFTVDQDRRMSDIMRLLCFEYLLSSPNASVQTDRIKLVSTVLRKFHGSVTELRHKSGEYDAIVLLERQSFTNFMNKISLHSLKRYHDSPKNLSPSPIFESLVETFDSLFAKEDYFTSYLFMQYALLFSKNYKPKNENGDPSVEDSKDALITLGQDIGAFVNATIESYGADILGLLCTTIDDFIRANDFYFRSLEDLDKLYLIQGILNSGSVQRQILAIRLLPSNISKSHEAAAMHKSLLSDLRRIDNDKRVDIFLNEYYLRLNTQQQYIW